MKQKFRIRYILFALLLFTATALSAFVIYANDYYRAGAVAVSASKSDAEVNVEITDGMAIFRPDGEIKAGFIFYPGGKVEYTAYSPLMRNLAAEGIACIISQMPFNLAVLDINAADSVFERVAGVDDWYIGGHSLGGSMAASYASESSNSFKGLILLGSYSTTDISGLGLDVLSICGSEDKVLNADKYVESLVNLPENFNEIVIDGGNHAYFGSYGEQEGDGAATITAEEQQKITAQAIIEFIEKTEAEGAYGSSLNP